MAEYTEGLIRDIRRLAKEGELSQIKTIYLGGGTPTHLGSKNLSALLYALSVSISLEGVEEFTVEANPESLTLPLVKDMWALGVNRLSLGVQTFDDGLLRAIGRIHSADDALRAIACAQERFQNVSVDLMCGLPGQTLQESAEDVSVALSAGIAHVSIYPLTLEKGTPLYRRRRKLELPDEDAQADMMEQAETLLTDGGFERYEVASYAKPGFSSKHNHIYWSGKPYLGLGRSAVTMTQDGTRRVRVRDGRVEEELDARQMAAEDAMLAMRTTEGLSKERAARFADLLPGLPDVLRQLEEEGLIREIADAWQPTHQGWMLGNELFGELLSLAP